MNVVVRAKHLPGYSRGVPEESFVIFIKLFVSDAREISKRNRGTPKEDSVAIHRFSLFRLAKVHKVQKKRKRQDDLPNSFRLSSRGDEKPGDLEQNGERRKLASKSMHHRRVKGLLFFCRGQHRYIESAPGPTFFSRRGIEATSTLALRLFIGTPELIVVDFSPRRSVEDGAREKHRT